MIASTEVFHAKGGGAESMAAALGLPFLGRIPMDPSLSRAGEEGRSLFSQLEKSSSMPALRALISKVIEGAEGAEGQAAAGGGAAMDF